MRKILSIPFETVLNPMYSRTFLIDQIVMNVSATHKIGINICLGTNINSRQAKIAVSYYTRIIDTGNQNLFEFYRNAIFCQLLTNSRLVRSVPSLLLPLASYEQVDSYYIIILGASHQKRRWSVPHFAAVANDIYDKHQLPCVLVGSESEILLGETFVNLVGSKVVKHNLIGKTTIQDLIKHVAQAKFIVTNETGISHLAVSLDKDVICISNGNHFGRFCPYPTELYSRIRYAFHPSFENATFAALENNYRFGSELDINKIQVEAVLDLVEALF